MTLDICLKEQNKNKSMVQLVRCFRIKKNYCDKIDVNMIYKG